MPFILEEQIKILLIYIKLNRPVCYVLVVLLGTGRMGIIRSLVLGVVLFVILSLLLQKALSGQRL